MPKMAMLDKTVRVHAQESDDEHYQASPIYLFSPVPKTQLADPRFSRC